MSNKIHFFFLLVLLNFFFKVGTIKRHSWFSTHFFFLNFPSPYFCRVLPSFLFQKETRKKWMHFCLRASGGSGGPCEVALITVFNSLASLWGVAAAAAAAYMQEANG